MEEINDIQNLEIASEGKQYIVVRLGTEFYGIEALRLCRFDVVAGHDIHHARAHNPADGGH